MGERRSVQHPDDSLLAADVACRTLCGVRRGLICRIARGLQLSIARGLATDHDLDDIVATIPAPASPLEDLVIRGLVYDWMAQTGASARLCLNRPEGQGYRLALPRPRDEDSASPTYAARDARNLIDQNVGELRNTRDVAARVRCEAGQLAQGFRRIYRISVARYLRAARVDEAIRLLRTTDLKVEAVAHIVGFLGRANLYHAVRGATGLTPAEVRRAPLPLTANLPGSCGPSTAKRRVPVRDRCPD